MKHELNPLEVKNLLRYAIQNNIRLSKENKPTIAYEIEGMPGTAKTSVIKQLGQELDHHYIRLNLAECEVCDLIGLPIYEYEVFKKGEKKWVSDKVLGVLANDGWEATGANRTSYSKPSWIQGKEDKPVMLVLDDYNRTTPMMTNACMTLIDEMKYISWGLPAGSTILLTCNPSDQDFMVQSEDSAQGTRRLKLYMKASVEVWAAEFAEGYGVDGRCINFLLKHPEIIEGAVAKNEKDGTVLAKGNLRIWTKYFDAISGIPDFSKEIDTVMNLGNGSLPSEHVLIFANFIKNGLDKLPAPKELLTRDIKWSIGQLETCIGKKETRQQHIAAILTKRLLNYAQVNNKDYTEDMVENYAQMIESGYLSQDLCVITCKKICTIPAFKNLAKRPAIMKILLNH